MRRPCSFRSRPPVRKRYSAHDSVRIGPKLFPPPLLFHAVQSLQWLHRLLACARDISRTAQLQREIYEINIAASIGMPRDGLDEAARRIVVEAAGNVRPPDLDGIRGMLDDAFRGRRPTAGHDLIGVVDPA